MTPAGLPDLTITGARVLHPGAGLVRAPLSLSGGAIVADRGRREIDLSGYLVLPGIVDMHGDGFERHLAARRGAMTSLDEGMVAAEAELAANGITTAILAQFASWEGGLRSPEFADQMFTALRRTGPGLPTDMRGQLRFETHLAEEWEALPDKLAGWGVTYVVFNDHLPHARLAEGRTPRRLTGQALKAGRSPERHLQFLQALHAQSPGVPTAMDTLCARLAARGIMMGSHDDTTPEARAEWRARGARVSEFPETLAAAEAAHSGGDPVVLGSPNVVRGGSHNGNVSAVDLIAMGLCDALASDYHYPSPRRAALMLADAGVLSFEDAWALVSDGPARVLGLADRGRLAPGLRADLTILDAQTRRVAATLAGGQVSYTSGPIAARFFG